MSDRLARIEVFDVDPGDESAFRAAWADAAPPGATLHRELGGQRFAGLSPGGPDAGVLLIVEFAEPPGAAWEPVRATFAARQGCLGAELLGDVAVVHWSSPLMFARTVREHGDVIDALPVPSRAALYAPC